MLKLPVGGSSFWWHLVAAGLAGLAAVAPTGCKKKKTAPVAEPVAVVVTQVQQKDVPAMVRAVGTLQANQIAQLSCELEGTLVKLAFEDGREVNQGDAIAQLDRTLQEATLASMQATVNEQQWEYDAKLKAYDGGGVSDFELATSKLSLETAIANRDGAKATVDKLTVRAPFSGRLGIHQPDVGTYLDAGDPIVQIVSDNPMLLDYSVPDTATQKLKVGQPVYLVENNKRVAEGKAIAINPAIDVATRSLGVRAEFPNDDGRLISGGFSAVQHQVGTQQGALLVPQQALTQTSTGVYVYLVTDANIAKQTQVEPGIYVGDLVVIEQGLEAGQTVVLRGWQKLHDGASVKRVTGQHAKGAPGEEKDDASSSGGALGGALGGASSDAAEAKPEGAAR